MYPITGIARYCARGEGPRGRAAEQRSWEFSSCGVACQASRECRHRGSRVGS